MVNGSATEAGKRIAMCFDQCLHYPTTKEEAEAASPYNSVARDLRMLIKRGPGIVWHHSGVCTKIYEALGRRHYIYWISGYGIGGLLWEPHHIMYEMRCASTRHAF